MCRVMLSSSVGRLIWTENAVVSGDVVTIGGQLERAEGAEVGGEVDQ